MMKGMARRVSVAVSKHAPSIRTGLGLAVLLCMLNRGAFGGERKADEYRNLLMERARTVRSLECSYFHERVNDQYQSTKPSEHTYRFSGANRYLLKKAYLDEPAGSSKVSVLTQHDGICFSLGYRVEADGTRETTPHGQIFQGWPSEEDDYWLTPHYLLGLFIGATPEQMFGTGEFQFFERNGASVLTQTVLIEDGDAPVLLRYDYYFDENSRLVRVVHDFDTGELAVLQEMKANSDKDVAVPSYVLDLSGYEDFGEIELPTEAVMTQYSKNAEDSGRVAEVCILTLRPDTVRINPELGKEDFTIEYPEGTLIVDTIADRAYFAGREPAGRTREFTDKLLQRLGAQENAGVPPGNAMKNASYAPAPARGTVDSQLEKRDLRARFVVLGVCAVAIACVYVLRRAGRTKNIRPA